MTDRIKIIRVLVVGCGHMGTSHAMAYHHLAGFEICGLVSIGKSNSVLNSKLGGLYPLYNDYDTALAATQPDAVCIATYPDTHGLYAVKAFEHNCHVFTEKPLADTIEGAQRVAAAAKKAGKKLLVGYILRYHPSWQKFIELSKEMGKPLVMRMNLNQQSHGHKWTVHRNLMKTLSPIVDCAVHYIDVMCQMTGSKPIQVSAIGARLTDDIPSWNYNYGQLQVRFEDGSIGWYETGWGPMVSDNAFFIKDVFGPKGSVSIMATEAAKAGKSDDIDSHTKTESIKVHYAALDENNEFVKADDWINLTDELNHQQLCSREQEYFLRAIQEDISLDTPTEDAINSLRIAFACDESVKSGEVVKL